MKDGTQLCSVLSLILFVSCTFAYNYKNSTVWPSPYSFVKGNETGYLDPNNFSVILKNHSSIAEKAVERCAKELFRFPAHYFEVHNNKLDLF